MKSSTVANVKRVSRSAKIDYELLKSNLADGMSPERLCKMFMYHKYGKDWRRFVTAAPIAA